MEQKISCGAIVNVLDFLHPHVKSLFEEGLWGFPDNLVNRRRWSLLSEGCIIFFYGNYNNNKGIYLMSILREKFENHNPVKYWVYNPVGYPLQIKVKVSGALENSSPVLKGELAGLGIKIFKAPADRWSLIVFGDFEGATYPYNIFNNVVEIFNARNKILSRSLDHDTVKEIIYNIGILQGKISEKEINIDNYRIDVAWKRIAKGNPYIVFEIHIHGNLEEALTKLKHARDLWNSKPVLVTTKEIINKAKEIASGAFHEIYDELKILSLDEIIELYEKKQEYKRIESKLGLF
ncbi:MAG: hypothetical protein ACP5IZ_05040 [Thermoprotei archaeon]|jgi:hypothetical protein